MADGMGSGDWPAWIALIATAVSAIWQIRTNFSAKTERRNLIRKIRIESLMKDIDEIDVLARGYWTKNEIDSRIDGFTITAKVKDISIRVRSYGDFLWPEAYAEFSSIKMLITGGRFQVRSRVAVNHDDPLIHQMIDIFGSYRTKLRIATEKLDDL